MPYREFIEWQAYYTLEPWDEVRADWRAGMLASVYANVNRDPKKKASKPSDFMPTFRPNQADDWQVMRERVRLAGKITNPRNPKTGKME